jgi:hypothetical protein
VLEGRQGVGAKWGVIADGYEAFLKMIKCSKYVVGNGCVTTNIHKLLDLAL